MVDMIGVGILFSTFCIGIQVGIAKLSAVDASGREFELQGYMTKSLFLISFGTSKALANLLVASVQKSYQSFVGIGWVIAIVLSLVVVVLANVTGSYYQISIIFIYSVGIGL